MAFLGLEPIFNTFQCHLHAICQGDESGSIDAMRVWLGSRRDDFVQISTTPLERELHRVIFNFLFEFLDQTAAILETPHSASPSNPDGHFQDYLVGDEIDPFSNSRDPINSVSRVEKGLEYQKGDETMEGESGGQEEEEEEGEVQQEEGEHDDETDLLSRHLVAEAPLFDSTHQPM